MKDDRTPRERELDAAADSIRKIPSAGGRLVVSIFAQDAIDHRHHAGRYAPQKSK